MRQREVIRKIKSLAKDIMPENSSLLLYGSRARGDARRDSDWDLLILLDKSKVEQSDYDNVSFPFTELGWDLNAMIQPHMYTKVDWDNYYFTPFYKNVERDKIVLWG